MENRYNEAILGKKITIWTREGLKFCGVSTWVDDNSVWLNDVIAKCERIVPWNCISSVELREGYKNEEH